LFAGEVLRAEIFRGPYRDNEYHNIALETLNLGHNEIHSLDRYLFQFTPNLTRLYLNNNPIEILDHVTVLAISSATNLEVKHEYFNNISYGNVKTSEPCQHTKYVLRD
jgi:Leucine-rich repeat (LRR) protein